jgi:hypothetical protein
MVTVTWKSSFVLLALAALLALPVATISSGKDPGLSAFHTRTLAKWPALEAFTSDPVSFFKSAAAAVADRVEPIVEVTHLRNNIFLYGFGTAPQRRITIGRNGYVFLNGGTESSINGLLESECLQAHSEVTEARLRTYLPVLLQFAARRNYAIHFVANPTMPTLYADFLPDSVAKNYREGCLKPMREGSPLERLADIQLIYPFKEMFAQRDETGIFYPSTNFHPSGDSVRVVRDAYLKFVHHGTEFPNERLSGISRISEILGPLGITKRYEQFTLMNPDLIEDGPASKRLSGMLSPYYVNPAVTRVLTNKNPAATGTALLMSDSFGNEASVAFATAFKRLIWVNAAYMKQVSFPFVVDEVEQFEHIDSMILLFQEGGLEQLVGWGWEITVLHLR